jgi:chromosome segregation ATPase
MRRTLLLLVFLGPIVIARAQELTKENWQEQMAAAAVKRDNLLRQAGQLETDVADLRNQQKTLTERLKKKRLSILALLGTTPEKVDEFSRVLDQIHSRITRIGTLSDPDSSLRRAEIDSVQALLTSAAKNKLSYLSENIDRIPAEQDRLDNVRQ